MTSGAELPKQVTVLGLGLFGGGAGAARYFAERGVRVIVSDRRNAAALGESIAALQDLSLSYHLGGHSAEDFAGSDVVIVNPAIAPDSPGLALAQASGARLDTEMNLLFRLCPAPILAVTGTHGKSTTVALLGEMLREAGRKTWVGGNLGGSLLPQVDAMRAEDVVVVEISSFQTQRLAWLGKGPYGAAVLNLTPNHLDRHADMAEYAAAKRELLRYQGPGSFALLNGEDPIVSQWTDAGQGEKLVYNGPPDAACGVWLEGERVRLRRRGAAAEFSLRGLRLPGRHNRFNAACAGAMAWRMGAGCAALERAVAAFEGLPDRLQLVHESCGVRFYNDSIATTPESAVAALEALTEPIVLVAGGSSKNHSFDEMGKVVAARCKAVVLVGDTAPQLARAILAQGEAAPPLKIFTDFEAAVLEAARLAAPGDAVLLAPACASFDLFRNYRERGRRFTDLVRKL